VNLERKTGETDRNPNVLLLRRQPNYPRKLLNRKDSKNGRLLFPSGSFVVS
jgi:hypothetical protein